MSLLNEIQFEANFAQSQKLVNESGIGNGMDMMKSQLGVLKDMQIEETA